MTRRAFLAILAAPVLIAVTAWLFTSRTETPLPMQGSSTPTPAARTAQVVADTPAPPTQLRIPKPTPQVLPVSNAFTTLEDYRRRRAAMRQTPSPVAAQPAARTPETELGHVSLTVRDFRAALGSNPVGNNREITSALLGNNARGVKFLDPATANLDAKGELLDAWGNPYFFHAMSGTMMEIRSAGPDGKLFTDDDLVK